MFMNLLKCFFHAFGISGVCGQNVRQWHVFEINADFVISSSSKALWQSDFIRSGYVHNDSNQRIRSDRMWFIIDLRKSRCLLTQEPNDAFLVVPGTTASAFTPASCGCAPNLVTWSLRISGKSINSIQCMNLDTICSKENYEGKMKRYLTWSWQFYPFDWRKYFLGSTTPPDSCPSCDPIRRCWRSVPSVSCHPYDSSETYHILG